jgi:transcriptional regulator with XRE-family HTH domain
MTARQFSVPPVFGRRLRRERSRRGWSMRDLAARCGEGFSPNTVQRAEDGRDITLSGAIVLAAALGTSLDALLATGECEVCDGMPPAGFICSECGRRNVKDAATREDPT